MSRSLALAALAGLVLPLTLAGCGGGADETVRIDVVPRKGGGEADGGTTPVSTNTGGGGGTSTDGGPVAATGTISGVVKFTGTKRSLAPLVKMGDPTAKDAAVCAAEAVPNEKLIVGGDGGVKNVFVYLRKAPKGDYAAPDEPVIFDHNGCVFVPHCLIAQVGQPLTIRNGDGVAHNVHTYPQRLDSLNKTVGANDNNGLTVDYDKEEAKPFPVKCDSHPWMIAYHLSLEHPFHDLTEDDGKFTIENVPSGDYELVVWHEAATGDGFLERRLKVSVPAKSENLTINYPDSALGPLSSIVPNDPAISIATLLGTAN